MRGRRRGERKGSWGRVEEERVFWVNSRGVLGGRKGRRKSILRGAMPGRILVVGMVVMNGDGAWM